jgi:DNA-binding NarL/FixJ family response regulator
MKPGLRTRVAKPAGNHDRHGAPEPDHSWTVPGRADRGARKPAHLTAREQQVLALMCQGLSNKAIARRLGIAPSTVKVHVSKIFRTLNVSTRLGAVLRSRCWESLDESPGHNHHEHPGPHGRHR